MLVRGEAVGGGGDSSRWHPLSVLECLMKGCLETFGLWDSWTELELGGSSPGLPHSGGLYGHSRLSLLATLVFSFRSLSWSNNLAGSV